MVAQVAVEAMKRVLASGKKVSKETIYDALNGMNGANGYDPKTTVGPVTYSKTDRAGVDFLQIYKATDGKFRAEFIPSERVQA